MMLPLVARCLRSPVRSLCLLAALAFSFFAFPGFFRVIFCCGPSTPPLPGQVGPSAAFIRFSFWFFGCLPFLPDRSPFPFFPPFLSRVVSRGPFGWVVHRPRAWTFWRVVHEPLCGQMCWSPTRPVQFGSARRLVRRALVSFAVLFLRWYLRHFALSHTVVPVYSHGWPVGCRGGVAAVGCHRPRELASHLLSCWGLGRGGTPLHAGGARVSKRRPAWRCTTSRL